LERNQRMIILAVVFEFFFACVQQAVWARVCLHQTVLCIVVCQWSAIICIRCTGLLGAASEALLQTGFHGFRALLQQALVLVLHPLVPVLLARLPALLPSDVQHTSFWCNANQHTFFVWC